jgi:hypothetical protein
MLFLHSNGLGTTRAVRVYQSSALMPFGSFRGPPDSVRCSGRSAADAFAPLRFAGTVGSTKSMNFISASSDYHGYTGRIALVRVEAIRSSSVCAPWPAPPRLVQSIRLHQYVGQSAANLTFSIRTRSPECHRISYLPDDKEIILPNVGQGRVE